LKNGAKILKVMQHFLLSYLLSLKWMILRC